MDQTKRISRNRTWAGTEPSRFETIESGTTPASRSTRVSFWTWELVVVGLAATVIGSFFFWDSAVQPDGQKNRDGTTSQTGHTRLVESVAFSPDGKTLASCGWDNRVKLWSVEPASGEPTFVRTRKDQAARLREITSLFHPSNVFQVAFSPDGKTLAAGGLDSFILWDISGEEFEPLVERRGESIRCLAYSPDGKTLAIGSSNAVIRLLDLPSRKNVPSSAATRIFSAASISPPMADCSPRRARMGR